MNNQFRISDNLIVDAGFKDFLQSTPSRIGAVINTFQTIPGINYIAITDKIDTISYLPQSKCEYVELRDIDPYSDGIGRVFLKVGRLAFKLFPKNIIDQYIRPPDVEEFVNQFKAFFDVSNRRLELVSGEDIRKYYLDNNYAYPEGGNLWKSCMRQFDRQQFLDIYVHNEVKMIVLFTTQDDVDRVRGRALLWEAEDMNGNKIKIMDRIYTIYDSDVFLFKRWAKDNGYISKFYQNAKTQRIFDINNESVVLDLKINLTNHKLGTYPYLDTFPFYDMKTGNFYNNELNPYQYYLVQSNGGLYPPDPEPDEDDNDYDNDYHLEYDYED